MTPLHGDAVRHGYERLADLAEREVELVGGGDLSTAAALGEERELLASQLPSVPPAEVEPELRRILAAHERVTVLLHQTRMRLTDELATIHRGRSTAHGYLAAAQAAAPAADYHG